MKIIIKILDIVLVLLVLMGIGSAAYPKISNIIHQKEQDDAIVVYEEVVQHVDTEDLDAMWAKAKTFNSSIKNHNSLFELSDDEKKDYEAILDAGEDGIIGYINIPNQSISLPVYHGTSDDVLEKAVGHIEGTSFPADGDGVHCVLTGHTGLPALDLFTDIREMRIGDEFTISSLNRTITYKVDRIDTVLPDALYNLEIDKDNNYCTLVTCTPYGVNDHRLLVRGKFQSMDVEDKTIITRIGHSYGADLFITDMIVYIGYGIIAVVIVMIVMFCDSIYKERN